MRLEKTASDHPSQLHLNSGVVEILCAGLSDELKMEMDDERWQVGKMGARCVGTCLLNQTLSSLMYGPSSRSWTLWHPESHCHYLLSWVGKDSPSMTVILEGISKPGDTFKGIFI